LGQQQLKEKEKEKETLSRLFLLYFIMVIPHGNIITE
jgi:hypothetical protein